MPFADDDTEGSVEAFAAEAFYISELVEDVVVEEFEVDLAGVVAGGRQEGILLWRGVYIMFVRLARRKEGIIRGGS